MFYDDQEYIDNGFDSQEEYERALEEENEGMSLSDMFDGYEDEEFEV